MKDKIRIIIWLALLFIILEGIVSVFYHYPHDKDLLSITNLGRYTRVAAALIALILYEKKS